MENDYRKDFPLLKANKDLVYIDNAATAQRPECVIQAEKKFYEEENANPLRGFYPLSLAATDRYQGARETVKDFIHAKTADEIAVTIMEHHSNLLPWQIVARQTGASLRFLECEPDGTFSPEVLKQGINEHTKLLAVTHVSNVLGCVNPVKEMASLAHQAGAVVVMDGAQSVPHMPVDVQDLDVDFLAFSGHKLMGPMGIGVLYGKKELLQEMPPFLTGGEMISSVSRESAVFAQVPQKFEAGTVNAAGAAGLQAAISYIQRLGFETIMKKEQELTARAMEGLAKLPYVKVLGSPDPKNHTGIVAFVIEGVHPHDVSEVLAADGIAVRAGHHCAQPLLEYLGVRNATRASFMFYNTPEEVDQFVESTASVRRRMGYGE